MSQYKEQSELEYLVPYLLGIRKRYAYDPGEIISSSLINMLVTDKMYTSETYVINRHINFLEQIVNNHIDDRELILNHDSEISCNIVLCIGASLLNKKYPVKLYAEVLNKINEHVTIIGGKNEIKDAEKLSKLLTCPHDNYVGCSLDYSLSLIKGSKIYIGNDTGMVHVASVFKKPSIVLYKEREDYTADYSAYKQFHPQYKHIPLFSDNSLFPCKDVMRTHGMCTQLRQHCIRTIKSESIVKAYFQLNEQLNERKN